MAELSRVRPEHKFDETSLHEYAKENLPGFPRSDESLTVLQYRFVFNMFACGSEQGCTLVSSSVLCTDHG